MCTYNPHNFEDTSLMLNYFRIRVNLMASSRKDFKLKIQFDGFCIEDERKRENYIFVFKYKLCLNNFVIKYIITFRFISIIK